MCARSSARCGPRTRRETGGATGGPRKRGGAGGRAVAGAGACSCPAAGRRRVAEVQDLRRPGRPPPAVPPGARRAATGCTSTRRRSTPPSTPAGGSGAGRSSPPRPLPGQRSAADRRRRRRAGPDSLPLHDGHQPRPRGATGRHPAPGGLAPGDRAGREFGHPGMWMTTARGTGLAPAILGGRVRPRLRRRRRSGWRTSPSGSTSGRATRPGIPASASRARPCGAWPSWTRPPARWSARPPGPSPAGSG